MNETRIGNGQGRLESLDALRGFDMLFISGLSALCLVLTLVWSPYCPIIMKLWSPTYVLANGAYSFAMLALFYWIIDVRGFRGWAFPLRVIGMNSITIYLMNRTGLMPPVADYFTGGLASLTDYPGYPALVSSLGLLALNWLVLYWFHRKNAFLKV